MKIADSSPFQVNFFDFQAFSSFSKFSSFSSLKPNGLYYSSQVKSSFQAWLVTTLLVMSVTFYDHYMKERRHALYVQTMVQVIHSTRSDLWPRICDRLCNSCCTLTVYCTLAQTIILQNMGPWKINWSAAFNQNFNLYLHCMYYNA